MADIGADIRTYLLADSAVSNLVAARVYSDTLEQGAEMPAVVCRIVSATPSQTLATTPSSFASSRMQIDSYAENRGDANTLAEKVRLRLQNKRGDIGDSRVSAIALDGATDYELESPLAGTAQRYFVASQDYTIHHQTATS